MQQKTGARLSMTQIDADMALNAWKDVFLSDLNKNYEMPGIPAPMADKMTQNTEGLVERATPYPSIDHRLDEGEIIRIGNYMYEVMRTPGHSDGLVCCYTNERLMLLATAHI